MLCLRKYFAVKIFKTTHEVQAYVAAQKNLGKKVGFVPTMGFLHEGHMSLVALSKEKSDVTIASIYVNPSQFNDRSDFLSYPKNEAGDLDLLSENGCAAVYMPNTAEIEKLPLCSINLEGVDEAMEGAFRPGHFKGVVEVVYRLFTAVQPDVAVFGEKDYQQLMVIQKMVQQMKLKVTIVGAPIVREQNGLAKSSRNVRLSEQAFNNAGFIYESLKNYGALGEVATKQMLKAEGFDLEYLQLYRFDETERLFIAGYLEGVRLIDNVALA